MAFKTFRLREGFADTSQMAFTFLLLGISAFGIGWVGLRFGSGHVSSVSDRNEDGVAVQVVQGIRTSLSWREDETVLTETGWYGLEFKGSLLSLGVFTRLDAGYHRVCGRIDNMTGLALLW